QMAEHGGRLGDRPHGVDDAEDGCDDAERRQCVGRERDRMRHRLVLRMVRLDLLVHQRLHLVMVVSAEGEKPKVIAEEDKRMPVGEEQGEALEERALVWLLYMLLEGERAL